MLNALKFRSKKGMSLAYALIVSLFLVMVTGGVTTIAILQHNETGADLNTRQAYISAKSGLDAMKSVLENDVIDSADLPAAIGDEKYYILYKKNPTDPVQYEVIDPSTLLPGESILDKIKDKMEEFIKVNKWTILGGEGTYFKITQNAAGEYGVTALNTTGKYNNNITENRGDLSFDVVSYTTHTFTDITPPPATTPTTPTTPTGSTTPTTPTPTEPPTGKIIGNSGGDFLMVGQQTALNELSSNSSGNSKGKMFNEYHKGSSGGSGSGTDSGQIIYTYSNDADLGSNRTYFPVVFDRAIKITTQCTNAQVAAYNQGVYMLGSYNGSEVDDCSRAENNNNGEDLGNVSYFTTNVAYHQSINCALLVIKNNFVARTNNPVTDGPFVNYYGDSSKNLINGQHYVYVYLPQAIRIVTTTGDNYINRSYDFVQPAGWYMIKSGSSICVQSSWQALDSSKLEEAQNLNLYDQIMSYYDDGGEIHSGANETENEYGPDNCVQITGNDGGYTGQSAKSGYCSGMDVDTFYNSSLVQNRSKYNIFFAPNMSPVNAGYYHWYAGRSFNMQWFREPNFVVKNGVHIRVSSPTVVLTIGPAAPAGGGVTTTISNIIEKQSGGNGSFKIYGAVNNNGTFQYAAGSCKLMVMSPFTVIYDGKSYQVEEGTYTGVPSGLDLFSDAAATFFETAASPSTNGISVKNSVDLSSSLMPASVNAVSNSFSSNIFTRLFAGWHTPFVTVISPNAGSDTKTIDGSLLSGTNAVTLSKDFASLYYKDVVTIGLDKFNVIDVSSSGDLVISRELSDGSTVPYLVFKKGTTGTYKIPCNIGEDTHGINLLDASVIEDIKGRSPGNYTVTSNTYFDVLSKEYY